MLGEKILEEKGRVTGTRVLETSPQPKVETSFEAQGTILGVEHRTIGTYWAVIQPSGTLYGEGNGVAMTKEGVLSWKGSGIGKFKEQGGISYRGTIYYQTTVERFLRLNGTAVVFEYEVDENNNTSSIAYEWK
ncbi:hypothetical protein L0244_03295 [bacterium]|nr:hypothetical protein [bacterium]MCI0611993.1 hypothetical protein [bacterium]